MLYFDFAERIFKKHRIETELTGIEPPFKKKCFFQGEASIYFLLIFTIEKLMTSSLFKPLL